MDELLSYSRRKLGSVVFSRGTVFPRNLTAARLISRRCTMRWQFEGGVYRDGHARAYTASIISLFVCTYNAHAHTYYIVVDPYHAARLQGWRLLDELAEICGDISRAGGLQGNTVVLSETSFICQTKSQELTVWFCLSKQLGWGKLEFLSPSTERYLWLVTLWMPSDYLYLVKVLHRHLLSLPTSLRTTLQGQTTWKDGSQKTSNFVSL